jgi:hypothetical protein
MRSHNTAVPCLMAATGCSVIQPVLCNELRGLAQVAPHDTVTSWWPVAGPATPRGGGSGGQQLEWVEGSSPEFPVTARRPG